MRYTCQYCNKVFDSEAEEIDHELQEHDCPNCVFFFRNYNKEKLRELFNGNLIHPRITIPNPIYSCSYWEIELDFPKNHRCYFFQEKPKLPEFLETKTNETNIKKNA